jgi:RHS repeat-associated protein
MEAGKMIKKRGNNNGRFGLSPNKSLLLVSFGFAHASFKYDGDGKRVKSAITTNLGTTTTYFVGNHYEVTDGVVTKYYYAGSQRIAMRDNGTLFFLLGDHLGSTSLVTFGNGNVVSETRYKAWGEVRYASGTTPTDYTYTGQYSYASDFGLMFYNARWYDPLLGRFAQPDNIIPEQSQGVQAWDRYAYTNNSPVRYTDPSGHCPVCLTAVIGAAVGGIVGSVGYTAYVAATGREFNSTHFWIATGGGAAAGALIGTGVGIAAGVGVVEATTTAIGAGEAANVACGGDMCASEIQQGTTALANTSQPLLNLSQSEISAVTNASTRYSQAKDAVLGLWRNGQGYTALGERLEATYLNMSSKLWSLYKNFPADFRLINQKFLDNIISAGKNVILETPYDEIVTEHVTSNLYWETQYLLQHGYKLIEKNLMVPK